MQVVYGTNMEGNPASVDLDTGVIYVNPEVWPSLSETTQKVILYHELGHLALDSVDDEMGSDKYAIAKIAGTEPESLRKATNALLTILDKPHIPESRKKAIIQSALEIDAEIFKNEKAKKILQQMKEPQAKNANFWGAIIAAAGSILGFAKNKLLDKRNSWALGLASQKTEARIQIIEACIAITVQEMFSRGKSKTQVLSRLANREQLPLDIFNQMCVQGIFTDNNIISEDWLKKGPEAFFKKYSWAPDQIMIQGQAAKPLVDELFRQKKQKQQTILIWVGVVILVGAMLYLYLKKK